MREPLNASRQGWVVLHIFKQYSLLLRGEKTQITSFK